MVNRRMTTVTKSGGFLSYVLSDTSRNELLNLFKPQYADVICHHVTYDFAKKGAAMPPVAHTAHVVGYADSGDGLEALVVEINGTTTRPDGKLFHITLSLDRAAKKKPFDSNNLVSKGFDHVSPFSIQVDARQIY